MEPLLPSEPAPIRFAQSHRGPQLLEFVDNVCGDARVVIEELLAQILERHTWFASDGQFPIALKAIFFDKTSAPGEGLEQAALNLGEQHGGVQQGTLVGLLPR
jgi:hypothetical protein